MLHYKANIKCNVCLFSNKGLEKNKYSIGHPLLVHPVYIGFKPLVTQSKDYSYDMAEHYPTGRSSSVRYAIPWYAGSHRFDPHIRQRSLVEIGREIILMAILSHPPSQEEQLSVTGERMCTKYW